MQITFHGAAQQVTGSCFLVETECCRFLVDCGMIQGSRVAQERNFKPFPFDPRRIDFVLLTHAHIDHSGLLPRLSLQGFVGPPDGQVKFPHPWPPQIPPGRTAGL